MCLEQSVGSGMQLRLPEWRVSHICRKERLALRYGQQNITLRWRVEEMYQHSRHGKPCREHESVAICRQHSYYRSVIPMIPMSNCLRVFKFILIASDEAHRFDATNENTQTLTPTFRTFYSTIYIHLDEPA